MSSPSTESQDASPGKTYRLMAGMAIAAIVLIGTVIYSLSQLNSPAWTSSLKDPVLNPTLRQELPQFEYSLEGKSLKAQNFEGRWTLLTFWAYWCAPCLEEMPALNQLGQQWQGPEFNILTVNIDKPETEDYEAARKFLTDNSIVLPTLFDKTGELKKAFAVTDLPQHFLISPDKKIRWQAKGAFKWNESKARDQLMKLMEAETEKEESTEAPDQGSEQEPEE
ncbi:MAG: TlpA family protein disulfide reductase [Bdellovibrionales bacterium]